MVRSSYTFLASTIRIPQLVQQAAREGYTSVALTDHNVLFGVPAFQQACAREGIQPIYGMEVDCQYQGRTVPFLLLALDNQGYLNLMKLSSLIREQHDVCTLEQLQQYRRHCHLIIYGEGGPLDSLLTHGRPAEINAGLLELKKDFSDFDMALSYQEAGLWQIKNKTLKGLCRANQIPTVALNKVYCLQEEDAPALRVLQGIARQTTLMDSNLPHITGRSFLSKQQMAALYEADDLQRTDEIAAMVHADLKIEKTGLPQYPVPSPLTSAQYLTQLCLAGLKKRGLADQEKYLQRLRYELDVITSMHYDNYFLIVFDFIRYARRQGIYVGPGRGSAAGSLAAYCLGITMLDPLEHGLLFERFLNPERVTMPDIDVDFADNRRQEVIRYVHDRYGDDYVADIGSFSTLGARQALKDVGRVMNLSVSDIETLLKLVPDKGKVTLASALKQNRRLQQIVNAQPRYKDVYQMAMRLEGLPRHTTIHAAGIVMSRLPVQQVVPTMRMHEEIRTTQYAKDYLEQWGLIKMDFLGVRNLTMIESVVRQVKKQEPDFSIDHIDFADAGMLKIFRDVDTSGIFQFDTSAMKSLLRKLKVHSFADVEAAVAIVRPGPYNQLDTYLANQKDPEHIVYPLPELKPVLQETYGVMLYQEQVMQTAQIAAGFSLARADTLRHAISKKNEKELASLREEFIEGCLQQHHSREKAEELFALISRFGDYGFNKSHAAAYAVVACQMAYLKAHYPLLFYCAMLDNVLGDRMHTVSYIEECRRRGVAILPPDVNRSGDSYQPEGKGLRIPLSAVRGVGAYNARAIEQERQNHGAYQDLFDFTGRVTPLNISRAMIEALIDAGALDCFGQTRTTLRASMDLAMRYAEIVRVEHDGGITLNLGIVSKPELQKRRDVPERISSAEREVLGFTLGPHPAALKRKQLRIQEPTLQEVLQCTGTFHGFAQITSVLKHRTRKGTMMAYVKVSDETAETELLVMPSLYEKQGEQLARGRFLRFHGKMSQDHSLILDRFEILPEQKKGELSE